MKKIFTALFMFLFTASYSYAEVITIWTAKTVFDCTQEIIQEFKAEYPEYENLSIDVKIMSEADSASEMIKDIENGADIFGFSQDQLSRLIRSGALEKLSREYAKIVQANNDKGSVNAATFEGNIYAWPMTSDNGYFLYYDSSVIPETSEIDNILAYCLYEDKKFFMKLNSGWYQAAFFLGTGCELNYEYDVSGNPVSMTSSIVNHNGLRALKSMIELANHSAFVNGSSASKLLNEFQDVAAIVSGTWDSSYAKEIFGENYAASKLPIVDDYQMFCFGGYKFLGIKPQKDKNKLAACEALANYLTNENSQLKRFNAAGWGPSNINAKQNDAVKSDEALTALNEQLNFSVPQNQYPAKFWEASEILGNRIISGELNNLDDSELLEVLKNFEAQCREALE